MKQKKPDFWLILLVFILLGFGLVMVFSTSYYKGILDFHDAYYFFNKQLMFAGIGLFLFFFVSNIPYWVYQKYVRIIVLISFLLLIAVLLFAKQINGARRWLELGAFSFQPSELVKLTMIIYTSYIMVKKQPVLEEFKRAILPPILMIGIFCTLLILQPHYSATIIVVSSCMIVIFCAGAKMRHLIGLASLGIPFLLGVLFLNQERVQRLMTAFDPFRDPQGDGYQTIYSLYAIGPGGLTGAGLGNSIQKMAYLPEAHTDFIFSIIAEELGFIGGSFLILLFILVIFRGIIISLRAPDQFGTLLGIGIISLIAIEAIFNLGVVTALLPVTGVPLPLISYGGSALMFKLIGLGIVLNISRYQKTNIKKKNQAPAIEVQG